MDAAVKAGPIVFVGGLPKAGEPAAGDAKLHFGGVGVGKPIAKNRSKCFGAGGAGGAVATGVFGKGGRLQQRAPVGIDVFVDDRFGAHGVVAVFGIPTLNKGIEACDGRHGVGIGGGCKVEIGLLGRNAHDAHPVAGRTKLFGAEHDVPAYVELEGVVVPKIGDVLLLVG